MNFSLTYRYVIYTVNSCTTSTVCVQFWSTVLHCVRYKYSLSAFHLFGVQFFTKHSLSGKVHLHNLCATSEFYSKDSMSYLPNTVGQWHLSNLRPEFPVPLAEGKNIEWCRMVYLLRDFLIMDTSGVLMVRAENNETGKARKQNKCTLRQWHWKAG